MARKKSKNAEKNKIGFRCKKSEHFTKSLKAPTIGEINQ
jgi:hypothetical protein